MNGTQLVAEARVRLRDTAQPYLWQEATILSYLNHAQRVFCERTHALVDYDCYTLQTTAGQARYELDPEILSVLAAKVTTQTNYLSSYSRGTLITYSSVTGVPTCYALLPEEALTVTLHPVPDAVYTINLAVAKLPSGLITLGSEPEIPAEYHMDLVFGALSECLIHQDADGYAPDLLDRYEDKWAVALRDAKRETYRRILGPNSKATAPSWTGG